MPNHAKLRANISLGVTAFSLVVLILALSTLCARARDDGRYAQSPLKPWFDSLRSGKGLCCSDADGSALSDVDWETKDGHYRARIEGEWYDVPDDAVLTGPNRVGRTMVWPIPTNEIDGKVTFKIRCFLPGALI